MSFGETYFPWDGLIKDGWLISGMNHYKVSGDLHLYCSMEKGNRCIKAEGTSEAEVFGSLCTQARHSNIDIRRIEKLESLLTESRMGFLDSDHYREYCDKALALIEDDS